MVYVALTCLSLGSVAAFISTAIIVVFAFRVNTNKGLLVLFLPFYIFYWAFAEFKDPKRKEFLLFWIIGLIVLAAGIGFAIAV